MTRRDVLVTAAAAGLTAAFTGPAPPVLELRQYTMQPGQRDTLIRLFEDRFIESQEALGSSVLGTFRDLDDPDRFVWLRAFPDMERRRQALDGFYSGPVWQANRTAANATIVDSDNVLLLKPAGPGFDLAGLTRAPVGAKDNPPGLVMAVICPLQRGGEGAFADHFARTIAPTLAATGAPVIAAYATDRTPNSYPRLPVRESDTVFIWFQAFKDAAAQAAFAAGPWKAIAAALDGPVEVLRLAPTPRSLITGRPAAKDGRDDFDFLFGQWRVRHRRLKARLAGSTEWVECEGWSDCRKTMGGLGTFDDNLIALPEGPYMAMGVRRFDIALNRWSIWWLDSRYPSIDTPVHGTFKDGVGTFIGADTFQGKPILVRFTWSKITPTTAHWSQAFSPDDGKTWEVNWDMDFERLS